MFQVNFISDCLRIYYIMFVDQLINFLMQLYDFYTALAFFYLCNYQKVEDARDLRAVLVDLLQ